MSEHNGSLATSANTCFQHFQESLVKDSTNHEDERDQLFGLSLRELIHTFKWQTLILLKAMLLQPKVCDAPDHMAEY